MNLKNEYPALYEAYKRSLFAYLLAGIPTYFVNSFSIKLNFTIIDNKENIGRLKQILENLKLNYTIKNYQSSATDKQSHKVLVTIFEPADNYSFIKHEVIEKLLVCRNPFNTGYSKHLMNTTNNRVILPNNLKDYINYELLAVFLCNFSFTFVPTTDLEVNVYILIPYYDRSSATTFTKTFNQLFKNEDVKIKSKELNKTNFRNKTRVLVISKNDLRKIESSLITYIPKELRNNFF